jgi:multidrug efflux pump subunit AcrB
VGVALAAQNQIIPAGTARIGQFEYNVRLNNAPEAIDALNNLPIKTVDGATVTMRDVANVHDGSPPQQNEVRVDGKRSVLMTVLKAGSASTIDIVDNTKATLKQIMPSLPDGLKVDMLSDQSLFVKGAISGVVREGMIARALTSLMILLFLGSWRSTVIIATSIPLAILAAVCGLSLTGETLNIMTLGGLALAVGILVDDATVTIENINWHLEQGKQVEDAIMDGAADRAARLRVAAVHLHRLRADVLPDGVAGFLFAPWPRRWSSR